MKILKWIMKWLPIPLLNKRSFYGLFSNTGVKVSEDTAMSFSAVFACVAVLSRNVAAMPTLLYRRLPNGGKTRATDHPLYQCLHIRMNPNVSAFNGKQFIMSCCLLWGNSYSYIVRDTGGRVSQLWPVHPRYVTPQLNSEGLLEYLVKIPNTPDVLITAEDMLHITNISMDGLVGKSAIQCCPETVGLGLAAETFSVQFYANGAHLDHVLTHPGKLSDGAYARVKEDFDKTYAGLSNAHKTAILEEGLDIKTIGMPLADAQLIESRKFQIEEIARIFNVPLHLIQSQDKANSWGAGIEQQNLGFVIYSLIPWLVSFEQESTWKLLDPVERLSMFVEFLMDALLRGTTTERYAAYAVGIQWGWLSPNDVRERENMNPIENGDIYRSPLNMVPLGTQPADTASGGKP